MTYKRSALRSLSGIAMLFAVACGTGDSEGESAVPHLVELQEAIAAGTVQRLGAADGERAIGAVLAARITPDGSRVVILDRNPPYLKVFRRDGSLQGQYLPRGDGPREMSEVATMAVDNDSAFIVGPYAVAVHSLDGSASRRMVPDFPLLDIGTDCAGRVIGYGPRGHPQTEYLHELRIDSSVVVVRSALQDQPLERMAWGFGQSSMVSASSGSVINHRRDGFSTPLFLSCDGETADRGWSWATAEFPSRRSAREGPASGDGSTVQLTFDVLAPMSHGAAELPNGKLLWLEYRLLPSEGQQITGRMDWFLADSSGMRRGYTSQRYVLQDAAAGMLLLSTDEPWPQVILLSATSLEQMLAQGSWRSRGRS